MDFEKQKTLIHSAFVRYAETVDNEASRRGVELCRLLEQITENLQPSESEDDLSAYSAWYDLDVIDGKKIATRIVRYSEDCDEYSSLFGIQVGVGNADTIFDESDPLFENYTWAHIKFGPGIEMRNPILEVGQGNTESLVEFGTDVWNAVEYTVQRLQQQ